MEISERADGPSAMIAAKNVIEPLVNFLKIDARYLQLVVSKTIANISKSKGGCAAIIAVGGISVLEGLLEKVQVEISAEAGLIQKNVEFALSRMREALPPAPVRQGSSLPVAEVMVRMQQSRRPGNNDCSMM